MASNYAKAEGMHFDVPQREGKTDLFTPKQLIVSVGVRTSPAYEIDRICEKAIEEARTLYLSVEKQPDYKCRYRYHNNYADMLLRWIIRPDEYGELEIALEYDVTWRAERFKGSTSWEELIDMECLDEVLAFSYRKEIMEIIEYEYYENYETMF